MTSTLIAAVMFLAIMYRVILRPCRCLGVIFGLQALATVSYSAGAFLAESNAVKLGSAIIVGSASIASLLKCGLPLKKSSNSTLGGLAALLGYSLFSVIWHPNTVIALSVWQEMAPYLLLFLVGSWTTVFNERDFAEGLKEFFIITFPVLVWALLFGSWGFRGLESMNSEHTIYGGVAGNVMGSLSLSTAAGMCCLASHVVLRRKGLLNSVLVFGVYVVMCILIARSGARGQLIAVAMAALILVSIHRPLPKIAFRLLVIAIAIGVVVTVTPQLLLNEEQLKLLERWDVSRLATGMGDRGTHITALWRHYENMAFPGQLFGLGNSYSFMPYAGGIYPHNVPFEVLCEEGVLGFILYCFVVCRTGWLLYLTSAKNKWSTTTSVPLVLFIFLGLLSLKSGSLLTGYAFLVLIVIGPRIHCAPSRPGSLTSALASKIDRDAQSAI